MASPFGQMGELLKEISVKIKITEIVGKDSCQAPCLSSKLMEVPGSYRSFRSFSGKKPLSAGEVGYLAWQFLGRQVYCLTL
jgi:hypothetical protein